MTLDTTIATTNGSIYGVWYEAPSDGAKDSWVLKREPCCPEGWGQRLEFQENGEFVDSYSAPCGNDGGLHHWSGNGNVMRISEFCCSESRIAPTILTSVSRTL